MAVALGLGLVLLALAARPGPWRILGPALPAMAFVVLHRRVDYEPRRRRWSRLIQAVAFLAVMAGVFLLDANDLLL